MSLRIFMFYGSMLDMHVIFLYSCGLGFPLSTEILNRNIKKTNFTGKISLTIEHAEIFSNRFEEQLSQQNMFRHK